jgi:hypothetical protein
MGLNLGTYSQTTVFDSSATGIQFPFASSIIGSYECHLGDTININIIRIINGGDLRDFTANWTTPGYHRLTMLCGAGNCNVRFDGKTDSQPLIVTVDTSTANLTWGIRGDESYDFEGRMNELIVWNIVPSDAVLLAIEIDQIALWTNSIKESYYYNGKIANSKDVSLYTHPTELVSKEYVDSAKSFIDLTPTTAPTAVKGRIYYDNASNYLKYYNGYEWRTIDTWTQPAMTSATTPAGYVVTSNSSAGPLWAGFDGILSGLSNAFLSFDYLFTGTDGLYVGASTGKTGIANQGVWNVLELPVPQPIIGYTLYSRQGNPLGNPKAWHIMYSLNGTNYVSVDHKSNYIFTTSEIITVTFSPIVAKYWGIQVYKANYSQMIFQELKFFT